MYSLVLVVVWQGCEAVEAPSETAFVLAHLVQEVRLEEDVHELIGEVVVEGHVPLAEDVGAEQKQRVTYHVDQSDEDNLLVEID